MAAKHAAQTHAASQPKHDACHDPRTCVCGTEMCRGCGARVPIALARPIGDDEFYCPACAEAAEIR